MIIFTLVPYYYFSIPIALIIALIFLNYFAMTFGTQSRLRKEALAKMEEVMAKEHELLSLGGSSCCCSAFFRNTSFDNKNYYTRSYETI
jgi:two-component system sensor histidine kinase RegB